jgi:hypothetical protein
VFVRYIEEYEKGICEHVYCCKEFYTKMGEEICNLLNDQKGVSIETVLFEIKRVNY